eukprot:1032689_1
MASSCLMILLAITRITSSINDSFNVLPRDIKALTFSHFTPEQHRSIRTLNKESQNLFVKLHATTSHEMNAWMQLKTFLSHANVTTEMDGLVQTVQLQNYTGFIQPFRCNCTGNQIIMIEKLFCVLINNPNLTPQIQLAFANQLFDSLQVDSYSLSHCNDHAADGIQRMITIFSIRVYAPPQLRHCTNPLLFKMWELAISEKRNTGNVENRYTLFALSYMTWITRTCPGVLQDTHGLLWSAVTDAEFIHYFLSFEPLLIRPIENKKYLIDLIINDVLANCTLQPKHLALFVTGKSVLWDLQYVIESATENRMLVRYYWSSMRELLHWIFEHKLFVEEYDPTVVMNLFIDNGVFTMDDVLCEIQPRAKLIDIVSFDLLKRVIDCKETTQHKERLHRWLIREQHKEREIVNFNDTQPVMDNVEMSVPPPRALLPSTVRKSKSKNVQLCCSVIILP